MMHKQAAGETGNKLPFINFTSPEFMTIGKKRVEHLVNLQTALLNDVQKAGKDWLDRMQSEMHLGAQLACRCVTARSVSDAMAAYQEWTNRWFQMTAEDVKHLFADTQKFMERGGLLADGRGQTSPDDSQATP
jgi:Phasin protein